MSRLFIKRDGVTMQDYKQSAKIATIKLRREFLDDGIGLSRSIGPLLLVGMISWVLTFRLIDFLF